MKLSIKMLPSSIFLVKLLFFLRLSILTASSSRICPVESAKNIPGGSITVQSNAGWFVGGWGFATPYNAINYGGLIYNWGSGNVGFGNFGDDNQGDVNFGSSNQGDGNGGSFNVGGNNCGNYNVGNGNVGDWNVGIGNVGSYNAGLCNSGSGHTGVTNTGGSNVGITNSGTNNIGVSNSASFNIGIQNSGGNSNIGYLNGGTGNLGVENVGNSNVGIDNVGDSNIGYRNEGDNNVGALNFGNENTGYLAGVQSFTINPVTLKSSRSTSTPSTSSYFDYYKSYPGQNVTSGEFEINGIEWETISIQTINTTTVTEQSVGWANVNVTNVGIGQSGEGNVGLQNIGYFNIGDSNEGSNNTGAYNIGQDNIGYYLEGQGQVGTYVAGGLIDELDITSVSVPTPAISFLNATLYGFMQDLYISDYPTLYSDSISTVNSISCSSSSNTNNLQSCSTLSMIPITNTFSISLRCRGSVKVTDLFCSGDAYNVYKDGKIWFSTPVVPIDSDPYCLKNVVDPELSYYDDTFSHGIGWLASGSYKITIIPIVTRYGGGAVGIKVDDFCEKSESGDYIRY